MILFPENHKLQRVSNAVAAGTTDVTSSAVSLATDFDAVTFIVAFGTITSGAVTSCKVQQSDDDGVADAYSDLEGSAVTIADDDDNKITYLTVYRPEKGYLKCVVDRATQNAVVDGIFAVLYGAKDLPVTHDATTVVTGVALESPDEGTA